MINVFYYNRHTIGQLMVALMFVSGAVFMFTFDGFVSESGAAGCCSRGEAKTASFTADSSGDFGRDILVGAPATGSCGDDSYIDTVNNGQCKCQGANCGPCNHNLQCNGNSKPGCPDNNSCQNGSNSCGCDTKICVKKSKCPGDCS